MEEIVISVEKVQPIKDICGEIRVLSSKQDFDKASTALVTMSAPGVSHYHKITTEFYFIIEGKGKLVIGANVYEIKAGTLILIPPNTAHYFIPREVTKILVFCIPAWSKEDEIVLDETDKLVAGYSACTEKCELIREGLFRCDLGFEESMSKKEREELDVERQSFVLRAGYNKMSIPELRGLLKIK